VILSDATYRKVAAHISAVPLPPVRVKGKTDELRVYNAVASRLHPTWAEERTG
jgi:class 3 adenylate cyclase